MFTSWPSAPTTVPSPSSNIEQCHQGRGYLEGFIIFGTQFSTIFVKEHTVGPNQIVGEAKDGMVRCKELDFMSWNKVTGRFLKIGIFHFQNPHGASNRSRIFLFSLLYVFMYLFDCVTPPGQTKNRPEIWYPPSPRRHLKTVFVFSKKWPWGPPAQKNCRVTWI